MAPRPASSSAAARRSRRPIGSTPSCFDKTGTLTLGRPDGRRCHAGTGSYRPRAARPRRLAREGQRAPARGRDPRPGARGRARLRPGLGLRGRRRRRRRRDGRHRRWAAGGRSSAPVACWPSTASTSSSMQAAAALAEVAGQTVAWVAVDGALAGQIALGDPLKPTAAAAVTGARRQRASRSGS